MANGASCATSGCGTWSRITSSNGCRLSRGSSSSRTHQPSRPDAYRIGNSSCCSFASSATNKSKTSSTTSSGRASPRSILLMMTIGRSPCASALPRTNFVCGIGPSAASVSRITPSAMPRTRSTSPPKSAWPGVSMILIRVSRHIMDVGLARMVMPRSFSRSPESIIRSSTV